MSEPIPSTSTAVPPPILKPTPSTSTGKQPDSKPEVKPGVKFKQTDDPDKIEIIETLPPDWDERRERNKRRAQEEQDDDESVPPRAAFGESYDEFDEIETHRADSAFMDYRYPSKYAYQYYVPKRKRSSRLKRTVKRRAMEIKLKFAQDTKVVNGRRIYRRMFLPRIGPKSGDSETAQPENGQSQGPAVARQPGAEQQPEVGPEPGTEQQQQQQQQQVGPESEIEQHQQQQQVGPEPEIEQRQQVGPEPKIEQHQQQVGPEPKFEQHQQQIGPEPEIEPEVGRKQEFEQEPEVALQQEIEVGREPEIEQEIEVGREPEIEQEIEVGREPEIEQEPEVGREPEIKQASLDGQQTQDQMPPPEIESDDETKIDIEEESVDYNYRKLNSNDLFGTRQTVIIAQNNKDPKDVLAVRIRTGLTGYSEWMNELQVYLLPNFTHENILPFYGSGQSEGWCPSKLPIDLSRRARDSGDDDDDDESDDFDEEYARNYATPLTIEYWLLNEFYQYRTLRDYLKKDTLTWAQMIHVARGIANGLHFLHENFEYQKIDGDLAVDGFIASTNDAIKKMYFKEHQKIIHMKPSPSLTIIHRNLSSLNIVLKADMTPRIWNFGLARVHHPFQPTNHLDYIDSGIKDMHLSSQYSPPELLQGRGHMTLLAMKSIDMYSCGILFWELISRCVLPKMEGANQQEERARSNPERYREPFEDQLKPDPVPLKLCYAVHKMRARPPIRYYWRIGKKSNMFVRLIEELWDQNFDARLQALSVIGRLDEFSLSDRDQRFKYPFSLGTVFDHTTMWPPEDSGSQAPPFPDARGPNKHYEELKRPPPKKEDDDTVSDTNDSSPEDSSPERKPPSKAKPAATKSAKKRSAARRKSTESELYDEIYLAGKTPFELFKRKSWFARLREFESGKPAKPAPSSKLDESVITAEVHRAARANRKRVRLPPSLDDPEKDEPVAGPSNISQSSAPVNRPTLGGDSDSD